MKGTYIILIHLKNDQIIKIGSLGKIYFKKGYYCYIGSAFGRSINIENRVSRHLRKNKKIRWHIDYFLKNKKTKIIDILIFENRKIECFLAKILSKKFKPIKKFGSSDCKCISHFYYCYKKQIKNIFKKLNFVSFHK
ncbi:MAG: GIY-YIG nuclease family protein [Candidatus Aenigmarchaeota archaeon]|nr:GIY-YIG nuclease family protein [Candidatus Aenigmarchaeota archaeon]